MTQVLQEKTNLKQLMNQLNNPPEYEKQPSWWAETSIIGLHSIHIYAIK